MDEYINNFKKKKCNKTKPRLKLFITKGLLAIIFLLCSVIYTNLSSDNKKLYKDYVLNESIHFTKIENMYEKLFGRVLPKDTGVIPVSNGKLIYKNITKYKDGEKLEISNKSIINTLMNGIVVYIGNKDDYNNTVIIQGVDGVDIWYGNLENISVKLYDYIEKDTVIGNIVDDKLYLVIKKDNEFITYEDYQS